LLSTYIPLPLLRFRGVLMNKSSREESSVSINSEGSQVPSGLSNAGSCCQMDKVVREMEPSESFFQNTVCKVCQKIVCNVRHFSFRICYACRSIAKRKEKWRTWQTVFSEREMADFANSFLAHFSCKLSQSKSRPLPKSDLVDYASNYSGLRPNDNYVNLARAPSPPLDPV